MKMHHMTTFYSGANTALDSQAGWLSTHDTTYVNDTSRQKINLSTTTIAISPPTHPKVAVELKAKLVRLTPHNLNLGGRVSTSLKVKRDQLQARRSVLRNDGNPLMIVRKRVDLMTAATPEVRPTQNHTRDVSSNENGGWE